ncbi:MAG TPA: galactokinase family protein, partial [Solirubrobacteraceae bacterium]|nr:galactokinase family protein [Solirubrobacteraceae bacterium]
MRSAVAIAPGRVNLIGEHTDYNQGLALPLAITQHVRVVARGVEQPWIQVQAHDLGETDSFPLDRPDPVGGWRDFVRGAVAELGRGGARLTGASLEITGTVPRGAGLGSSAALAVALVLALREMTSGPAAGGEDRLALARLCSRIENDWVGARTGLLDQLACLLGREAHALLIDFCSLQVTPVPLELGGWKLVTLDSGQPRANAASGYNQRREECAQACRILGRQSLREVSPDDIRGLPAPLDRRVRHVLGANARVCEAVQALHR